MRKIEGQALMRTQRILSSLVEIGVHDVTWLINKMDWVKDNIIELEIELEKIDLPVLRKKLTGIKVDCEGTDATLVFAKILKNYVAELRDRIEDEIETRYIFAVSSSAVVYLNRSKSIVNPKVESAFPTAIFDLHEAAFCIGYSRYTASVFHLMRAMESAIEKIGSILAVTVKDKNDKSLVWGKLIDNIKTKVDALPAVTEREDWKAIFSMPYSVKETWRNSTMHPKQTYTEEEACEVFEAVRSFIRRLAEKID